MSRFTPAFCRLAAGAVVALTFTACADTHAPTGVVASGSSAAADKVQELNDTKHVFHTKDFYAKTNAARPQNTGITYHGGTVIAGPAVTKIVAIYWGTGTIYQSQATGTGSGAADPTLIGSFLRSLGGSPYFNINSTYYNAAGSHVLNQVQYTSFWSTGTDVAPPSGSVTDAQMVSLIQQGINLGKIAYDPNTVYAIFSGNGVNLGGGFSSASLQYCAYHTHGATAQGNVYFAAMPYNQQFPSSCTSGLASPNADVAANSEVNTLAHEIEETTTDAMGNAWYDSRGYENADKCAWTWGTTFTAPTGGTYNMKLADGKYYLVQRNWVNSGSGGCAISF
ncbi:MAG: phosphate-responsive 1 family protein [Gemmatimonadetes bacterium]|nr:phosphate-responsive 1 family protein [Gemmatimonadota bacterium]